MMDTLAPLPPSHSLCALWLRRMLLQALPSPRTPLATHTRTHNVEPRSASLQLDLTSLCRSPLLLCFAFPRARNAAFVRRRRRRWQDRWLRPGQGGHMLLSAVHPIRPIHPHIFVFCTVVLECHTLCESSRSSLVVRTSASAMLSLRHVALPLCPFAAAHPVCTAGRQSSPYQRTHARIWPSRFVSIRTRQSSACL
jgi:hypothetical protein